MKDAENKRTPKGPARDNPEIRAVGIDVKPAPDAQARLRRLFSILVKLAEDDLPTPHAEPSPENGGEEQS